MQTVKGTTPDTSFSIEITAAKDSEGSEIPTSDFSVSTPESDNLGAVEILDFDAATRSGTVRFGTPNPDGSPNIANLTANILNQDGSIAAPIGDQIAVVHGDVASFEGGFTFNFASAPTDGGTGSGDGDTELPAPTDNA